LQAVVYYARSIDVFPTAAVYNNRAMANLKMKRYLRVVDDANEVIKLEPLNFKAHIRKATACKESNRADEALAAVTTALEIKPTSKEALALKTALLKKEDPKVPQKKKRMVIEEKDENDVGPKIQDVSESEEEEEDGEYDPEARYHMASKFKGAYFLDLDNVCVVGGLLRTGFAFDTWYQTPYV
jgi:tetratricopeptide (TPR) repeat protein